MNNKLCIILATLSGIFFVSGLVIIKNKGEINRGETRKNLIYA